MQHQGDAGKVFLNPIAAPFVLPASNSDKADSHDRLPCHRASDEQPEPRVANLLPPNIWQIGVVRRLEYLRKGATQTAMLLIAQLLCRCMRHQHVDLLLEAKQLVFRIDDE